MKHYSLVIEPKLVKEIDALVKKYGLYSSRSDFIRDSIRQRLIELKQLIGEQEAEETEAEKKERKLLDDSMDEFKYRGVY